MRFLPFFAFLAPLLAHAQPAFPGAQGFAANTPGGRGGEIIRVTSLARQGAGTLGAALRAKGPRIVVFEVGGVIDLQGHSLKVTEPFLTIAGATAPGPGITIVRGGLDVATHDVVIRHIAVRPGEAGHEKKSGWECDGLSTVGGSYTIVDHCSFTWATDENLSASGERFGGGDTLEQWRAHASHHITYSNNLIAEGLSHSTHMKGEHSKGSLLHDNGTYLSIIGNLYASNVERNPLCKGGVHAVIVNNWINNPGRRAIHHALVPSEWEGHPPVTAWIAVVGNIMEYGPNTPAKMPLFLDHTPGVLELFMHDNIAYDRDHQPVPLVQPAETPLSETRPPWPEGYEPMPAEDVKDYVATNAGARPWGRDPIDARIIRAALEGTGKIVNSEVEAGGYPERPETHAPFKPEEWDLATMERKK